MKKHLVMIVGNYYPEPSPTGKCAAAYVELLKDQFDISVICLARTDRVPYGHNGMQVYPAASSYKLFQHRLEKKNAPRILQNLAKIPVHLRHRFSQPNNLYSYVKAARKELEKLHKQINVDVVFSVGAPMAAHVAAGQFRRRHPDIRWVTYTVDSYAAQNKNTRHHSAALAFESSVLGAADAVLLSEEIYESCPSLYRDFTDKCTALPYLMPLTPVPVAADAYFDTAKINLVYAGRFYKNIRNPEYLLQLALQMNEDCVLHLYCQSDCDSLIDDYVRRSGGKLQRHKPVSSEQIQKIYAAADVLVSVGNNTPEFKPSKTFEYIATGKPILNIYYEGLADEVLAQSPLTLQLQRGTSLEDAAQELHYFVRNTRGKILSREEIDKNYFKHSEINIKRVLQIAMGE